MKQYLFLMALLLHPFFMQAQNSDDVSKSDSLLKRVVIQNGRYVSVVYTLHGEVLTGSQMKSILNTYPGSAEELSKYYRQRRAGWIMLSIMVTGSLVGIIQARGDMTKKPGTLFSKAPIPFSISIGGGLLAPFLYGAGTRHYNKAVKAYNNRL